MEGPNLAVGLGSSVEIIVKGGVPVRIKEAWVQQWVSVERTSYV